MRSGASRGRPAAAPAAGRPGAAAAASLLPGCGDTIAWAAADAWCPPGGGGKQQGFRAACAAAGPALPHPRPAVPLAAGQMADAAAALRQQERRLKQHIWRLQLTQQRLVIAAQWRQAGPPAGEAAGLPAAAADPCSDESSGGGGQAAGGGGGPEPACSSAGCSGPEASEESISSTGAPLAAAGGARGALRKRRRELQPEPACGSEGRWQRACLAAPGGGGFFGGHAPAPAPRRPRDDEGQGSLRSVLWRACGWAAGPGAGASGGWGEEEEEEDGEEADSSEALVATLQQRPELLRLLLHCESRLSAA